MSQVSESQVAELRQLINQLSSTIETQKRLLKDLEEQQVKARRTLNSLVDPMAHLPFEIQSQIFVDVVSSAYEPTPHPGEAPMVLLGVCQLWRTVALSTPQLWTRIQMNDLPRGPNYTELCRMWLERAGSLPLRLTVHGSMWLEESVQDLLEHFAPQLDEVTLYLTNHRGADTFTHQTPHLEMRSLKTVTITSECEAYFRLVHDWVQVLKKAPALLKYSLENIMSATEDDILIIPHPENPLVHPTLRELRLGDPQEYGLWGILGNSARILNSLTLPSLTTLHLSDFDITTDEFISFLLRSSPPLQSLAMVIPAYVWPIGVIAQYFYPIPNLTNLELVLPLRCGRRPFSVFLEALLNPRFLHNLHTLAVFAAAGSSVDFPALIRTLTSRRHSAFRAFRLSFASHEPDHDYAADLPQDGYLWALRELCSDSMSIHVGTSMRNMI
ncbi:hypothetical protein R3P38DRAFT_1882745 [Favolaschia claudopus]|uniref:F-box domain-containing protein n=1 Tax=Favolaschia claudopus TaxID=2862362 RepID=A0AAW0DE64_9AGAR